MLKTKITSWGGSLLLALASASQADLVVYYNFDSDDASDSSSNGLDGTLIDGGDDGSLKFSTDVPSAVGSGKSIHFNDGGYSSDIMTTTSTVLDNAFNGMDFTVSFWFKANALPFSSSAGFFIKNRGNGDFFLRTQSAGGSNDTRFRVTGSNGGQAFVGGSGFNNTAPSDPVAWFHFALVAAPDRTMTPYVNGVAQPVVDISGTVGPGDQTGDGALVLGFENNRTYNILMDDFALFDEQLTAEQIAGLADGDLSPADFVGPKEPDFRLDVAASGGDLVLTWDSQEGKVYDLLSSTDPETDGNPNTWAIVGNQEDIAAEPPTNTLTIARPADATRFYVIREDDAPPPPPPPPAFFDDFESVPNPDWTTGTNGGDAGTTVWERGAPINVGPTSGYDGSATCFGTNISADYTLNTDIWLRTPPIDLTGEGLTGASLSFFQHRDTDLDGEVDDDYGTIRVLDANSLAQLGADIVTDVEGFDFDGGNNPIWAEFEAMPLPAEAIGKEVVIEFRFKSDDLAATFAGWYIDNVTVDVTND